MAKHVVVIGGGVAGTAAAHQLINYGYKVTIVEQNDRLGGRVHSQLVHGAAVEMGAGFITRGYTNLWAFLAETGLSERLYRQYGSSGVFRNGQITMATPQSVLAGNQLLSWPAKLHAVPLILRALAGWPLLDVHAFWKSVPYDTRSLADIFKTKSGKEFFEYALQPVLNGYFYWAPERTSQAMMLILCKAAFSHGTYKMRGGLQRIPEKAAEGSKILLGHIVEKVQISGRSLTIVVKHAGRTKLLKADGIVCATTASVVPKIVSSLTTQQRQFFAAIEYSSAALIARTYKVEQTCGNKAIAFPRREGIGLSSVTLAPEPGVIGASVAIIKTYASGATAKQFSKLSNDALTRKLIDEMDPIHSTVLVGNPSPIATHVQRWPEALPFFDVGHFRRLEAFERGKIEDPDQALVFAGDYIGGPFMEGAFTSGIRAAERLHDRLSQLLT